MGHAERLRIGGEGGVDDARGTRGPRRDRPPCARPATAPRRGCRPGAAARPRGRAGRAAASNSPRRASTIARPAMNWCRSSSLPSSAVSAIASSNAAAAAACSPARFSSSPSEYSDHAQAEPLAQRRERRVGGAQELALGGEVAVVLRPDGPGLQRQRSGPGVVGGLGELAQRALVLLGERDGDRLHQLAAPGATGGAAWRARRWRRRPGRGPPRGRRCRWRPSPGRPARARGRARSTSSSGGGSAVSHRLPSSSLPRISHDHVIATTIRYATARRRSVVRRSARSISSASARSRASQPQLVATADVRLGLLHEVEDERGVRGFGGRRARPPRRASRPRRPGSSPACGSGWGRRPAARRRRATCPPATSAHPRPRARTPARPRRAWRRPRTRRGAGRRRARSR